MYKLSKPDIDDNDIQAVIDVLKSGWLAQGPQVKGFEEEFRDYCKAPYSLAVNSATSGLHIALMALGVGPGDEVIVPAFSWVATANAVELCGGTTVFVDVDARTFNTTIEAICEKITPRTKAIIPVHLFGKPFDVKGLKRALPRFIPIIEDAACAAGARINNDVCGTLGEIAVFSFHPRKSITTGEGGMILTADQNLYQHMAMLRNHGQNSFKTEPHPAFMADCPIVGLNYRMTDIQGALGRTQLKKLDRLIDARKALTQVYKEELSNLSAIQIPAEEDHERHSWQSYTILVEEGRDRNQLMADLLTRGIETRPGTHAIHALSYFAHKYSIKPDDFPGTLTAHKQSIALPLFNDMSAQNCQDISNILKDALNA